jgi:hypothetical protein
MRHVYNNHEAHDRTPAQRQMRRFMNERQADFHAQMGRLEKEHRDHLLVLNPPPQAKPVDQGTENALAKVDMLLNEFDAIKEREAEATRPKFKCPNCGHVGVLPVKS